MEQKILLPGVDIGGISSVTDGAGVTFHAILHRPESIVHVYRDYGDKLVKLATLPGDKHSGVCMRILWTDLVITTGIRGASGLPYEASECYVRGVATPPRKYTEKVIRECVKAECLR